MLRTKCVLGQTNSIKKHGFSSCLFSSKKDTLVFLLVCIVSSLSVWELDGPCFSANWATLCPFLLYLCIRDVFSPNKRLPHPLCSFFCVSISSSASLPRSQALLLSFSFTPILDVLPGRIFLSPNKFQTWKQLFKLLTQAAHSCLAQVAHTSEAKKMHGNKMSIWQMTSSHTAKPKINKKKFLKTLGSHKSKC